MSDDETPGNRVLALARQLVAALATDPERPVQTPTALGTPILAWTLEGHPAYWVFPLLDAGADANAPSGALRLTFDGEVLSISHSPSRGHATAAGIDQDQALSRAQAAVPNAPASQLSEPRLVMDAYPGREAWLVEVRQDQRTRRLLISSGGVRELT